MQANRKGLTTIFLVMVAILMTITGVTCARIQDQTNNQEATPVDEADSSRPKTELVVVSRPKTELVVVVNNASSSDVVINSVLVEKSGFEILHPGVNMTLRDQGFVVNADHWQLTDSNLWIATRETVVTASDMSEMLELDIVLRRGNPNPISQINGKDQDQYWLMIQLPYPPTNYHSPQLWLFLRDTEGGGGVDLRTSKLIGF